MRLQVWSSDCSFDWHGLRQDEGVAGNGPRVSGARQEGSQRVSQARCQAGLEISRSFNKRSDRSVGETSIMKTPTRFQWYRILRQHYQFSVSQSLRGALWLAG